MTPDRRKLLNECLAPGEGELYHTTITAFTGTKEDIEWLKAFRNGELKKRTMYQRLNLIEDARMQIEKWEAKAKRDAATPVESEPLYKCVNCDTPGFTARGIGAHAKKCKGINRSTALAPVKAIDGKAEVVPAIDLPTIRQALEAEREQLIVHEDNFEQTRLPHFLRMGLECVKAHAAFAVPDAATRGAMGGAGKSSPTVGELSTPTSFDGWLAAEVRWLSSGTAYRYRRAALGLGLTHESTPEELATLLQAARAEAGDKPLSLTQLVNRVPLTLTSTEDSNTPEDKAGEARTQVHDWIGRWDRHEKTGGLEDADVPTLKQLDEFLSNTLARIRQRIKSAAPAKKGRAKKAAKPAAKKATKPAAKKATNKKAAKP